MPTLQVNISIEATCVKGDATKFRVASIVSHAGGALGLDYGRLEYSDTREAVAVRKHLQRVMQRVADHNTQVVDAPAWSVAPITTSNKIFTETLSEVKIFAEGVGGMWDAFRFDSAKLSALLDGVPVPAVICFIYCEKPHEMTEALAGAPVSESLSHFHPNVAKYGHSMASLHWDLECSSW